MKIPSVTLNQMREIDGLMIEEYNISLLQMMENAGRNLAQLTHDLFPDAKTITVLVGKGNNGGGGLVAARHLHNHGMKVSTLLASHSLKEAPSHQLKINNKIGIRVKDSFDKTDIIIDALLGYNAIGNPRNMYAELIAKANSLNIPIISLDIPSGFDLRNKKWGDPHIEYSVCLTLAAPKKGMEKMKRLYLGDISVPRELYKKIGIDFPDVFKKNFIVELR